MLCSICHKNEAVICYTEIINGVKKEQYLCSECAAKYTSFTSGNSGTTPGSLLAGLLTSVLGQTGITMEEDFKKTNLVCPKCGMTYNEFLKYSKFGCPECVHTFGFLLDDYLKKLQGSCEHCGKKYNGAETVFVPDLSAVTGENSTVKSADILPAVKKLDTDDAQVAELKERLGKAIKEEEYEEAARIRDQIRALEAKEANNNESMV